jgi:hypothetical protein
MGRRTVFPKRSFGSPRSARGASRQEGPPARRATRLGSHRRGYGQPSRLAAAHPAAAQRREQRAVRASPRTVRASPRAVRASPRTVRASPGHGGAAPLGAGQGLRAQLRGPALRRAIHACARTRPALHRRTPRRRRRRRQSRRRCRRRRQSRRRRRSRRRCRRSPGTAGGDGDGGSPAQGLGARPDAGCAQRRPAQVSARRARRRCAAIGPRLGSAPTGPRRRCRLCAPSSRRPPRCLKLRLCPPLLLRHRPQTAALPPGRCAP